MGAGAIRWLNQPGRPHALPLHGPIYIWAAERHLENGECFGRSPQASAGSARETKSEEGAVIEEPESSL